jgi:mannose-6-phosphate isomerase-like protein (cupin superfamily)
MEQVYFFTQGRGKMIVGDETIDVRDGDAVYGPPKVPHGLINDSDDWVEHLIMSANVP